MCSNVAMPLSPIEIESFLNAKVPQSVWPTMPRGVRPHHAMQRLSGMESKGALPPNLEGTCFNVNDLSSYFTSMPASIAQLGGMQQQVLSPQLYALPRLYNPSSIFQSPMAYQSLPSQTLQVPHLTSGPYQGAPVYYMYPFQQEHTAAPRALRKRRKIENSTSKYRGVSWHKRDQRWVARAWVQGRTENLGTFTSELLAAIAVDHRLIRAYGRQATPLLNYPDDEERSEIALKELDKEVSRTRESKSSSPSPSVDDDARESVSQSTFSGTAAIESNQEEPSIEAETAF